MDEFATRTHTSYLTERVRMAQEESSIRREFIARLFNQASPTAETVSQVAAALGVDRPPASDSWRPVATPR